MVYIECMSTLITLLDSILGPHKAYAKGEYYFACPFCFHHNRKFAVNINKKAWHCWHCDQRGNRLLSLFRKLDCSREQIHQLYDLLKEDIPYINEDIIETYLTLPREFHPLYIQSELIEYKHALLYLKERGITAFDIMKHNIGFCTSGEYKGRIIIPSYDEDRKLNFFTGRSYFKDEKFRYKNPPISKNIIGFDWLINWNYPVVLVEGVFDAIAVKRNSIPLFGKTLPKKLQEKILIKRPPIVYILLDSDALKQTTIISQKFMNEGIDVRVVEVPTNIDASDLGFEEIQKRISSSESLTFKNLIEKKLALVQ